jgi:O-antigen/teichoic acid export membrane protein/tetratricopeptide (TPR) repeat protein
MRGAGRRDGPGGDEPTPAPQPAGRQPLSDARRERRQFITHNAVAGAGTIVAGVLGLLLQALVSHHFKPAQFGSAFAVFTFFTVLTQPAAGFGRMVAWSTSRELATGDGSTPKSSNLLRSTNRRLLVVGGILVLLFTVGSPVIADFLHVPVSFVILGAVGVPFMLSTAPLLASLQGEQRWLPWSALSVAIAAGRVVCVFLLVLLFGITGVVAGISLAAAVIYVVALFMVWPALQRATGPTDWRPQRNFLIVSIASTLAVAVLMGCDVLLVQHFFSRAAGGQFSAVTVTSRALFFAMGSVTSVLFPKVAARQASARSTTTVVFSSVVVGLIGGLLGLLVFSAGSDIILRSFAGRAYVGGAGYIGWYALGMPLLASVVMLSNSLQSLADLKLLWVLIPGALLKPLLIIFFHDSLLTVAIVSDISIGILFVALAATYVIQERRRLGRAAVPSPARPLGAAMPPPLPVASIAATSTAAASMALPMPESATVAVALSEPPPPPAPRARIRLRRPDLSVMRRRSWWRSLIDRPRAVIAGLAVLGLVVRHAWISTVPLATGDWHWPDRQRLLEYFPWPSVWDGTLGLGGENRFVSAFRYPVAFISGLFATLGATWTFIEQVLYFIPFAVLLPVSGWLLAREIMGRTRWALLTPILLLGNAYFLLESDGEIPLTLAEVVSMLVLIAFIRTMRRRSLGWAAITGLGLGVTAAFDIRPAYLCALLMAMYFVVLLIVEHGWALLGRRVVLGAVAGAVFLGSQAFWMVPLLTYHGNAGFPTPQAPDFNILTLAHGLTGVSAFWTGGAPAQLVQAPLNPAFMILPLLALAPLLARRLRPEVLWLTAAALLFAFFAKTDTAPLGGVYDWMYLHVPGWKLFREGSKFLYIVGLAYAILIPIALASFVEWARSRPKHSSRMLSRGAAMVALAGVVALSCSTVAVMESGALGSTTVGTSEPASFAALSNVLASDSRPGAVLWFGQPLTNSPTVNHHFLIASPTHPAVNLTGSFSSTKINQRDPFQLYCANNLVPFCYVDPTLFPYLTQATGAGYVVVPGGANAGSLRLGITRTWLASQMQAMFGAPTTLGSGDTALLVWRMPSPRATVSSSPAIALVDSGTWSTPAALPALQALNLPVAYRQSFDSVHYPVAPSGLADTVRVLPQTSTGCQGSSGGSVGIMAQSTAASVDLTVAGAPQTLPLLAATSNLSGWGVYGPVSIAGGSLDVSATNGDVTVGPCIAWSSLAATALAGHTDPVSGSTVGANGEQVTASSGGTVGSWVELRRYYDPGWRLDGRKPTTLGDGLFNLYHLTPAQATAAKLDFSFSTIPWEHVGQAIAVIVVVASLVLVVVDRRRRQGVPVPEPAPLPMLAPSPAARWIAGVGLGVLAFTALAVTIEWLGLPSGVPATSIASDPYATDVGYGALAVALLLLSLAVRVVTHVARSRHGEETEVERRTAVTARMGFAATLMLALTVLMSACGSSPGDLQSLLSEAGQAGSLAPSIQGSAIDDAVLQRASRDPALCIADYTTALQAYPDDAAIYVGRGDCYVNGGQNAGAAIHDYQQAIALSPPDGGLYLKLAVADRVAGNYYAAISDYQQAASVPSATAGQLLSAIDGLVHLGDIPDAKAMYANAIALQPQSAMLHVAAAAIQTAQGNNDGAALELDNALQLATDKAQTASVLGQVCHTEVLAHRYTQAASDCATAAQLSGGGAGAEDDLSAAALALGDLPGALKAINLSIGTFISGVGPYAQTEGVDGFGLSNLYSARGWIDVQMHNVTAGIADFQAALAALPPGTGPDARARIKAYITTAKAD